VLRRILLHEFPYRTGEIANNLAEFLNGFWLPLKLEAWLLGFHLFDDK
jgi:hypothetical protein